MEFENCGDDKAFLYSIKPLGHTFIDPRCRQNDTGAIKEKELFLIDLGVDSITCSIETKGGIAKYKSEGKITILRRLQFNYIDLNLM